MKPKALEWNYTKIYTLYWVFLTVLLAYLIESFVDFLTHETVLDIAVIAVILSAMFGRLIYRSVSFKRNVAQHLQGLSALVDTYHWQLDTSPALPLELDNSSLLMIADREAAVINYLKTPEWNYIDLTYTIFREFKGNEYRAAHAYCSVLVAQLPRIMPNVFFDSKSQGGRQYKAKFVQEQRHSLEGDFDRYFDTYFAQDYTIDSLSFVTPDVMLALEAAKDYDIEILGDRLLLYAPIYVDSQQLIDGAAKLQAILHSLQRTTSAYRDDRLPYSQGKQTVTPLGMHLKRRRKSVWVTVAIIAAYIILRIIVDAKIKH